MGQITMGMYLLGLLPLAVALVGDSFLVALALYLLLSVVLFDKDYLQKCQTESSVGIKRNREIDSDSLVLWTLFWPLLLKELPPHTLVCRRLSRRRWTVDVVE